MGTFSSFIWFVSLWLYIIYNKIGMYKVMSWNEVIWQQLFWLIDCCLMSSKLYFSNIQNENKFNNI